MAKPDYTIPVLGAGGLLAAYLLFKKKPETFSGRSTFRERRAQRAAAEAAAAAAAGTDDDGPQTGENAT